MRTLLWAIIAWPLPALIAGALGWSSVWGSGGATADYLIPLPVAGGVLHLPSFILCAAAVALLPRLDPDWAPRLRALLIGVAAAGGLWLLNLDDMLLALQTGATLPGRLMDANPLGLFLASDALLALLFTSASTRATQQPWLRLEWLTPLLLLAPAAAPLAMHWPKSESGEPFREGASRQGPSRNDEVSIVFTRLKTDAPDFRARAEAWAAPHHPRFSVNADDRAVHFTRDLDAARRFDTSKVELTLCQYEDDTPARWLQGLADCFSGHQSFTERFRDAYAARPAGEPPDVRGHMAARDACAGAAAPPANPPPGLALAQQAICAPLERQREELLIKHPELPQLQPPAKWPAA